MKKEVLEKLKDKNFVEKIMALQTKDEVIESFKKENLEISKEDINQIGKLLSAVSSKISTIPESELNNVGGGIIKKVSENTTKYIENLGTDFNSDFMKDNAEYISDAVIASAIMLTGAGIYKAGKWITNHKHWYLGTSGIIYDKMAKDKS